MEIIQSFYYSSDVQRQQEIEHTLKENLNKSYINRIHLFIDDRDYNRFMASDFQFNMKVIVKRFNSQPTYPELFKYACAINDTICCICNSDIEFRIDDANLCLLEGIRNEKTLYILSRHEYNMTKPQIDSYCGSHDAVIFHSTTFNNTIANIDTSYINYIQNTSGIEALLIIFFIDYMHYNVHNPCLQIVLIHNHKSEVRQWAANAKLPVGYIHPTPLNLPGVHCAYMINPVIITSR